MWVASMQSGDISVDDAVSALGVGSSDALTRVMVAVCDAVNGPDGTNA